MARDNRAGVFVDLASVTAPFLMGMGWGNRRRNRADVFVDRGSGLRGWKVRLSAGRPLATPAIADGRLFLGGGFGTYDFYALDAIEGRILWRHRTSDDGPTAAVVEDGLVAYNTESCTLEILTTEGKSVWQLWLGDPLLSMPAICAGRVYMAYPDSRRDHQHYLACFDLRSGALMWRHPIICDVITAPVVQDGLVYASCMDGTVFCLSSEDGKCVWQRAMRATSAPTVVAGEIFVSQRHDDPQYGVRERWIRQRHERAARARETREASVARGKTGRAIASAAETGLEVSEPHSEVLFECQEFCAHLDLEAKRRTAEYRSYMHMDASVGFAAAPAAAKFHYAAMHLGVDRVSAAWGFQGSRPCVYQGRLYAASGRWLRCLRLQNDFAKPQDQLVWEFDVYRAARLAEGTFVPTVTPPVVLNDRVIVGSAAGDLFCLDAENGEVLWHVHLGEPISYQPAVAYGRVYVPTATGLLYALETGSDADDGWYMWGANAAHTNSVSPECEFVHAV